MKKLVLCSTSNDNCPVVENDATGIFMKDDYGGKVKLTKDQFKMLLESGKKLL